MFQQNVMKWFLHMSLIPMSLTSLLRAPSQIKHLLKYLFNILVTVIPKNMYVPVKVFCLISSSLEDPVQECEKKHPPIFGKLIHLAVVNREPNYKYKVPYYFYNRKTYPMDYAYGAAMIIPRYENFRFFFCPHFLELSIWINLFV